MQIGLVTYKPEFVQGYDVHVFFSKWVDGQAFPAAKGMQNDVTVFCDAKAIREDPRHRLTIQRRTSLTQEP